MAASSPKLSPKSHKRVCSQAKTTLSPRRGNLSSPRSSLQFCLGISWKSSLYNSCRLVSGHQNLHRKGTSVPKTSFIFMQYWHDSWGILAYCALAHETTPHTHVGCSDTKAVIWGAGAGFGAQARDTREHFRFSLLTHVWTLRSRLRIRPRAPKQTSRNHNESDRKGIFLGLVYLEMDARLGGVAACLYNPPF